MPLPAGTAQHGKQHEDRMQRQRLGMHVRKIGGGSRAGGRNPATDGRRLEGIGEVRPTDRIEDDVEALPTRKALDIIRHLFRTVVDRIVGSQPPGDRRRFPLTDRHRDLGAELLGELDRDMPHAARTTMDQDMVAGFHARPFHRIPGRNGHEWKCGGLPKGQGGWLMRDQSSIRRNVLGKAAAMAFDAAGATVDSVADLEADHPRTDRFDGPGEIAAENGRHRRTNRKTFANLEIDRVDRCRRNLDQNLSRQRFGPVDFTEGQFFGPPYSFNNCARTTISNRSYGPVVTWREMSCKRIVLIQTKRFPNSREHCLS